MIISFEKLNIYVGGYDVVLVITEPPLLTLKMRLWTAVSPFLSPMLGLDGELGPCMVRWGCLLRV